MVAVVATDSVASVAGAPESLPAADVTAIRAIKSPSTVMNTISMATFAQPGQSIQTPDACSISPTVQVT